MLIGRRNCKVTIQQQGTQTQSSSGQLNDNWETYKQVWMEIAAAGGGERSTSRQVLAEATSIGRYDWKDAPAVTTRMRVVYGSRTFDIIAPPVNVGERNQDGELQLRERNP